MEEERMIYRGFFEEMEVSIEKGSYVYGGGLYLSLNYEEDGCYLPYGDLTVNFEDSKLAPNEAYVATNNMPYAEAFIEKYKLGEPTGKTRMSGYCVYPLYRFHLDRIEKLMKGWNRA